MALKATLDTTSVIEGVELCRPKVDKSREQGLTVYESLDEIQRQYDVVSLINVFSHVPDPLELIQEIKTKLVEHGELLLVTGNGGDVLPSEYPGKYYFPEHLIFAGEKHIVGMLRQAGFEIIKMYRYPTFLPKQPRKPASIILVRDTFISAGKYIIKKALKKPIASQSAQSPFRSLWIRARRGE
jgi:SAM-dependent methyltransferase